MANRLALAREDTCDRLEPDRRLDAERTPGADDFHGDVASAACAVISELGSDPVEILRDAGCDPRASRDGGTPVSNAALGRLLQLGANRTRCGHLGLLVGRRIALAKLGPSGTLVRNAGTVGDALRVLENRPWAWTCGSAVRLSVETDLALLHYFPYEAGATAVGLQSEGALATIVNIVRALSSAQWSPSEVLLPRAPPRQTDPYRHFFRAPVRFDQEWAAIAFPSRVLEQPIAGADRDSLATAERRIRQIGEAAPIQISDQLRCLLRMEFIQSPWSGQAVARHLAVHRRTLSRRLRAEGTSFRSVTTQIRFETAKQLLAETNMTLAQISACLGFSEAAAFTHAFRRWSGLSPSIWRHRCRPLETAAEAMLPSFSRPATGPDRAYGFQHSRE
ncbi:AraC family transcriptional regulator [Methylobacterium mesophilicum SR1.6/6]|uniref:AraC family transcriptional regulator n=1 Tax=Methylobacterium mesophilicum SR1.6/6 TaxID=908290 RepID=A0A6B9FIR4_9HYPH|nr:AraC family transcriptional regulator [Methylobacterium mesophilicum]QGY02433.1 AraC family transcriptional regulator [Methylobacterium mesophilicum SR1.6/6]